MSGTEIKLENEALEMSIDPNTEEKFSYKNSFSYSGAVLWNSLPLELRKAESLNQFKRLVKDAIKQLLDFR